MVGVETNLKLELFGDVSGLVELGHRFARVEVILVFLVEPDFDYSLVIGQHKRALPLIGH